MQAGFLSEMGSSGVGGRRNCRQRRTWARTVLPSGQRAWLRQVLLSSARVPSATCQKCRGGGAEDVVWGQLVFSPAFLDLNPKPPATSTQPPLPYFFHLEDGPARVETLDAGRPIWLPLHGPFHLDTFAVHCPLARRSDRLSPLLCGRQPVEPVLCSSSPSLADVLDRVHTQESPLEYGRPAGQRRLWPGQRPKSRPPEEAHVLPRLGPPALVQQPDLTPRLALSDPLRRPLIAWSTWGPSRSARRAPSSRPAAAVFDCSIDEVLRHHHSNPSSLTPYVAPSHLLCSKDLYRPPRQGKTFALRRLRERRRPVHRLLWTGRHRRPSKVEDELQVVHHVLRNGGDDMWNSRHQSVHERVHGHEVSFLAKCSRGLVHRERALILPLPGLASNRNEFGVKREIVVVSTTLYLLALGALLLTFLSI